MCFWFWKVRIYQILPVERSLKPFKQLSIVRNLVYGIMRERTLLVGDCVMKSSLMWSKKNSLTSITKTKTKSIYKTRKGTEEKKLESHSRIEGKIRRCLAANLLGQLKSITNFRMEVNQIGYRVSLLFNMTMISTICYKYTLFIRPWLWSGRQRNRHFEFNCPQMNV